MTQTVKKTRALCVANTQSFLTAFTQAARCDTHFAEPVVCSTVTARQQANTAEPEVVVLLAEGLHSTAFSLLKSGSFHVPVIAVLTAAVDRTAALQAGAQDVMVLPEEQTARTAFFRNLLIKANVAASLGRSKRLSQTMAAAVNQNAMAAPLPAAGKQEPTVIAIGASTGGTEAILEVIRNLPETMPGIVIVQHMPPVFTNMYAQRLNGLCKLEVREAKNMDRVHSGLVLIAEGSQHMRLFKDASGYYVKCQAGPKVSGHCPSVNVLFESVAKTAGKDALGVLLTGMGADGAQHLLTMRQAGAYTIGQDKESSVVYGMPMEAYKLGAVCKQLPLNQVAGELIAQVQQRRKKQG